MIVVDTNVLVDIFGSDPTWGARSLRAIHQASARGEVVINDIVYAEVSPGFQKVAELESALDAIGVATVSLPRTALFLAGRVFGQYRRRGGTKTNVLPDFFIGAHAAVEGASLLTRDPNRVRACFPTVQLISP